jgi:imidazolonepropionase-like amidohydrolase
MRGKLLWIALAILATTACTETVTPPSSDSDDRPTLVLVNGTLLNGTGAEPVPDAVLVLCGAKIGRVGRRADVRIPPATPILDVGGGTILPGFINAHVHDAYSGENLEAWAREGVTTVRDEGILSYTRTLPELIGLRDDHWTEPRYARLVSAGWMISPPGGYGWLYVTSPEDAREKTDQELDEGADQIKVTMEDGYGPATNLPVMSFEELSAIVETAHARGVKVSAHVTESTFMQTVVDAGVDDVAHMVCDQLPDALIQQVIAADIYVVTTLTVMEAYGVLAGAQFNLSRLVAAGVKVAMANDYTNVPQNGFDHFELGMPMHEITRMHEAGMSPGQIIVASTKNAAHVCGLGDELGTLETGKAADVLVVNGNPLENLSALTDVRLVIHGGAVIRYEGR